MARGLLLNPANGSGVRLRFGLSSRFPGFSMMYQIMRKPSGALGSQRRRGSGRGRILQATISALSAKKRSLRRGRAGRFGRLSARTGGRTRVPGITTTRACSSGDRSAVLRFVPGRFRPIQATFSSTSDSNLASAFGRMWLAATAELRMGRLAHSTLCFRRFRFTRGRLESLVRPI